MGAPFSLHLAGRNAYRLTPPAFPALLMLIRSKGAPIPSSYSGINWPCSAASQSAFQDEELLRQGSPDS
jgi:hypothetical protein